MSRTQEYSRTNSPVREQYFLNMREGKLGFLGEDNSEFKNIEFPFHFILLDSNAFRVTGTKRVGRMDRKVKSTLGHQSLSPTVSVYFTDTQEVIAQGKWRDIRDKADAEGGRYMSVLFCAKPTGEIITLNLKGSAYAEWLKFTKEAKGQDPAVFYAQNFFTLKGMRSQSNSMGNSSFVPVFEIGNIAKKETIDLADKCDMELQKYFSEIFSAQKSPEVQPFTIEPLTKDDPDPVQIDDDDLPF